MEINMVEFQQPYHQTSQWEHVEYLQYSVKNVFISFYFCKSKSNVCVVVQHSILCIQVQTFFIFSFFALFKS